MFKVCTLKQSEKISFSDCFSGIKVIFFRSIVHANDWSFCPKRNLSQNAVGTHKVKHAITAQQSLATLLLPN
jgi:hypothetical protein